MKTRVQRALGLLILIGAAGSTALANEPAGIPGLRQRLQSGDRDIREPWEMRPRSHGAGIRFDNGNLEAVMSRPPVPTVITLERPCLVDLLETYHWNAGCGAPPGTIGLLDPSGRVLGPWQAEGIPDEGGVPDAYWRCFPAIVLEPGIYQVVDSSPESWSWNAASGGCGMVRLEGMTPTWRQRGERSPWYPAPRPAPVTVPEVVP